MSTPLTVVIADDAQAFRLRLVALLSELEHVRIVGEAGDVDATLDAVASTRPDVVILDIELPEGDGIGALKRIKQAFPDILVLMLSNYAYPRFRSACLEAGASFFFDKATEFEQVVRVLDALTASPPSPTA